MGAVGALVCNIRTFADVLKRVEIFCSGSHFHQMTSTAVSCFPVRLQHENSKHAHGTYSEYMSEEVVSANKGMGYAPCDLGKARYEETNT